MFEQMTVVHFPCSNLVYLFSSVIYTNADSEWVLGVGRHISCILEDVWNACMVRMLVLLETCFAWNLPQIIGNKIGSHPLIL
jgi:hypothetical protein